MSKSITIGDLLASRRDMYALLSSLFREELEDTSIRELRKMQFPLNSGSSKTDKGHQLLHSYLHGYWERTEEDLRRDYFRTFIGSEAVRNKAAYPNESVYTSEECLIMQDARDEAVAIYRAAGFENSALWKSGEDHIATELEYMQMMSERAREAQEKNDNSLAERTLLAQYHFLKDHLLVWVPAFANDILKFSQTDFYRAFAYLTVGYIEEDCSFLLEVLGTAVSEGQEASSVSLGDRSN